MTYRYTGLLCGILPIRFDDCNDGLYIEVRFLPDFFADIVCGLFDIVAFTVGYEDGYPITNIKEIE